MAKVIGVKRVSFEHGGRYDTGFWVGASVEVIEEDKIKSYQLSSNESEDLEYTIMKWVKKRLKVKVDLT